MSKVNCAIYVRKSTEKGLEQEFNSLHNQEDSCKAYITSQAFNEWEYYDTYEDGGISGGSMKRPSLQRMLKDIEQGKIQTVIVYKIDRLSRSILDFHKMMKVFDVYKCNFVSITQAFDTSTSMGKLTLNMLLSFAQFEREISSERVRDKIHASKVKGMWTGGPPKLGYDVIDKKLIINPDEADLVNLVFNTYLELKSIRDTAQILQEKGCRNKQWITRDGKLYGGKTFNVNNICRILQDKLYIGRIRSLKDNKDWPGQHDAIIDKELWNKVQSIMKSNLNNPNTIFSTEPYMLSSLLQTNTGEKFRKDKAKKDGKKTYRYYVNNNARIPAGKIEHICSNILEQISIHTEPNDVFEKIVFFDRKLTFYINKDNEYLDSIYFDKFKQQKTYRTLESINEKQVLIEAKLLQGYGNQGDEFLTESEINTHIIKALAYGWRYRKMIKEEIPIYRIEEIEKIGNRKLYKYLNLTYLSPKIIDKIMTGKLNVDLAKLCNIASKYKDFSEQERALL